MVYRRAKTNIRKPRRRRASTTRRRASYRKTPSRRRNHVKQACESELTPTAKFALAQLDPFEPKCLGAKVPDSNTMPSIANCDTDLRTLPAPSVAGRIVAAAFFPNYGHSYIFATEGASSVTWSNTNFVSRRNFSNVARSVEAIRPVAHAVRMTSALAPTSTTGFVHIGLSVESRISNSTASAAIDLPTTINEMTGLSHYKRITLASLTQSPITAINKWLDETGFRYDDSRSVPNYAAAQVQNDTVQPFQSNLNLLSSWATIVVMIEGAPAAGADVISFEHLLMTECLPRKDAWVLGTGAAPNSPGTMSAVSTMTAETDFVHTEAQQESYVQQGLNAFERGAAVAGERVWTDVAAPLLTRFGNAAINTGVAMAISAATGRGGIPGVNSNPGRLSLQH